MNPVSRTTTVTMEASIEQIINTPRVESDPEMASIIKELNEEIEKLAQGPISPIKKPAVPKIRSRYPNKRGYWQAAQGLTDEVTRPKSPKKIRIRPYTGTINSTIKKGSPTPTAAIGNPASTATQNKIHKPVVKEDVWLIDCSATKHLLRRNGKGELVTFDKPTKNVNTPLKNQPISPANTSVMPSTSQAIDTVKKVELTPVIAKSGNIMPLITFDNEPEVTLRPNIVKNGDDSRKTKLTTVIAKPAGTIPLITLGNESIGVPPPTTERATNSVALIEATLMEGAKKKRRRRNRNKRHKQRYIFTEDAIWEGTKRGGIMVYVEIDKNKRLRKEADQMTAE